MHASTWPLRISNKTKHAHSRRARDGVRAPQQAQKHAQPRASVRRVQQRLPQRRLQREVRGRPACELRRRRRRRRRGEAGGKHKRQRAGDAGSKSTGVTRARERRRQRRRVGCDLAGEGAGGALAQDAHARGARALRGVRGRSTFDSKRVWCNTIDHGRRTVDSKHTHPWHHRLLAAAAADFKNHPQQHSCATPYPEN